MKSEQKRKIKKRVEKKFKNMRQERGITLIALVITIVILIILSVVTINATFGNNGLIKQTEYARDLTANSTEAEYEGMNSLFDEFSNLIGSSEVEQAKENGNTFNTTMIISDDLQNKVAIPGGFHIAEDSGTKVEEGIVIEDDIGNQFVWIPVGTYQTTAGQKTNNLSRRTFTSSGAIEVSGDSAIEDRTSTNFYYGEGNENSVAKNQIEEFKNSTKSITEGGKGGFYIGRYEAGTETERTADTDSFTIPLVQANKHAYVYVTRDQAKTQSEAMYENNESVESELISSYSWDTALNFICQNSEEGYLLATTTDSTYGNIYTSTKQLTGVYAADNYCNIHDLLGNYWEWTTEFYDKNNIPCVIRGSCYSNAASIYYAASRSVNADTTRRGAVETFRLQIYIK